MLRLGARTYAVARWRRRAILRFGFLGALGLAATEISALVAPFIRVNRIEGLGSPVAVGTRAQVLELFRATNDRPVLFQQGRFFLLHAPGGIVAAYRKCTHLGCAAPWNDAEDRFHCPCHGSQYDKRTAVVLRTPRRNRCSSFTSPRPPRVNLSSTPTRSGSSTGKATGIRR